MMILDSGLLFWATLYVAYLECFINMRINQPTAPRNGNQQFSLQIHSSTIRSNRHRNWFEISWTDPADRKLY